MKPNTLRPGQRETYSGEELQKLVRTLSNCKGNVTKAAADLGITRQKAQRMLAVIRRTPSSGSG